MCACVLAMSKRKGLYNLSFKLKAVKCVEEKTKETAAHEFKVDPRMIHDPGVHICLYMWWPLTTLSFEKYDRSPAIDITLIMLWLAPRNKFSLFNAGLD